ncbi:MAG: murein biosynthesis integral membrane protein MurJ [Solirubrobacteraceae bacterium]
MSAEAGEARPAVDVATLPLARPAAVMAVGTALSRLSGLGRVVAMAFALGVAESRLADSYNIANTLPNVLYELVLGGVLTSVFIPVLVEELRTKPHDEAWRSVSALVTASLALLVALTVVAIAAAPLVIDVFTGRVAGVQAGQQHQLATFFFRFFAPQIALYGFAAVAAALLNAHGRFAVPMFAPILNNVVVIAMFLVFAALTTGVPTNASVAADPTRKLLLALGTTGGVAAMAAVNWPYLRRLPGRLRVRLDLSHPAVRKVARLSAWTLLYVVLNTLGFGVSFYLANAMQGGPTAYVTAFAFFQLPYGIAAVSIITALVPRLAARHVDGDTARFRAAVAGGLRTTALLMLPATAAYLVLARPMTQVLLEHGVVKSGSVGLVASTLQLFAVGLLPFAAFLLFARAFYARQDTRTPALVNIVENAVTIALDFTLFPVLDVRGLALAHSLGYVAGAAVMAGLLARRIGGLELGRTVRELVKVVLASCAAAAAMVAVAKAAGGLGTGDDLRALVQLAAGGAAGLAVFLAVARALAVEDLSVFRRLLPG